MLCLDAEEESFSTIDLPKIIILNVGASNDRLYVSIMDEEQVKV